jgi:hydrogenase maturation factor
MDINKIMIEKVMLKERRISRRKVGIGIIITKRIAITAMAIMAELDIAESKKVFLATASELAIFF